MEQKLHDGKYFSIEKVKLKHRWEIKKSIQEKEISNPVCIESLKREFEIGSQLQHPFICSYYQLSNDGRSIHREYVDGITWNDYFDTYPDEISFIEKYILQIMEAIHYMHSRGIFHMDLKSENILINQEIKTIKIIDFGHAVYHNDTLWRGGVQSKLKTEKLISAEQDWNSFFFIIQLMKTKILRNSAHKIEKANKLFVKNENQLDFQQTKAIFESKSKIRINSKLIVFICFALAFFLLFRQLNRPEKDYLKKTKPKVILKSTSKPENQVSTIVESNSKEQKSKDEPSKIIHRIISVEDSMFFVVKASLFGPEFENELKTKSDSIKKIELFEKLMDKYSVKFEYYAQKHNLDSLKKLKAKEIYEYHLSKSINKYVHMLK